MRSARSLAPLLVVLIFSGCNSLNVFCGSSRPSPTLFSISPSTVAFAQMPSSFPLVLTGSQFVAASVAVFDGGTLTTQVNSSSQITVTITSSIVTGPGSYGVQVQTPGGTSGQIGCSSGGKSATLTLTVN